MLVVHQLARILLDVDAFDADLLGRGVGILVVQTDLDGALAHQRVVELADLVALRQVGVEIVRSEEHTSELQSLMRISYAVFCLKKKITKRRPRGDSTIEVITTSDRREVNKVYHQDITIKIA